MCVEDVTVLLTDIATNINFFMECGSNYVLQCHSVYIVPAMHSGRDGAISE